MGMIHDPNGAQTTSNFCPVYQISPANFAKYGKICKTLENSKFIENLLKLCKHLATFLLKKIAYKFEKTLKNRFLNVHGSVERLSKGFRKALERLTLQVYYVAGGFDS